MLTDPTEAPTSPFRTYAGGALLALLGAFTAVWTKAILEVDFGPHDAARILALGSIVALHGVALFVIARAALARWQEPSRNTQAMAVVGGYLVLKILYLTV